MSGLPVACRIDALSAEDRALHTRQLQRLQTAVREVEELPNGYAFRLDASIENIANAAAWIALERLCCPFFDFAIDLKAGEDALRLRLTGPEGAKAILAAALQPVR